jgi:hypothetical protein
LLIRLFLAVRKGHKPPIDKTSADALFIRNGGDGQHAQRVGPCHAAIGAWNTLTFVGLIVALALTQTQSQSALAGSSRPNHVGGFTRKTFTAMMVSIR